MGKPYKILFWNSVLQHIVWGYKNKLSHLWVGIPTPLMVILNILQEHGIIDYYYSGKNIEHGYEQVLIFLKYYRNQPILQSLKIFSKPSHLQYLSYVTLKNIILKPSITSTIFLISTPKGIVSGHTAIKNRNGGILLAKIN